MSYSDTELKQFERMRDDLILGLFENNDKRYWIMKIIKRAFDYGKGELSE